MKNKILLLALTLLFFSCKSTSTTPSHGHGCGSFTPTIIDSIFIRGEHIHLFPECLCSYEENEWYYVENTFDEYNNLIID